jgi:hypothetical protein
MKCEACGRECRRITVDFGIGAYEYWGAPGYDVRLADVSDCCEADCVDDFPPEPTEVITEADMELDELYAALEASLARHQKSVSTRWTPQPTKETGETS